MKSESKKHQMKIVNEGVLQPFLVSLRFSSQSFFKTLVPIDQTNQNDDVIFSA